MSKELEALNKIKKCLFWSDDGLKKIDIIEKALKALEIIKKLSMETLSELLFFIRNSKGATYEEFAEWFGTETPIVITREEYDLLKEVLL